MSDNKKIQLPINDIYQSSLYCEDRYLWLFGGWGSAKSYSGVFKKIWRLHTERDHKFLFVRKVQTTLKESLFDLVENYITNIFQTRKHFKINKTDKSFYLPHTNGKIIMAGLDDVNKLKSITGITGILIEEITELTEGDLEELDRRLRGDLPNYKQIVGMFNPVNKNHWIKEYVEPEGKDLEYPDPQTDRVWRFGDTNERGQTIHTTVYNTTYEHNHFIDDEYETLLLKQGSKNADNYEVGIRGRWGNMTPDNPAWRGFNHDMQTEGATLNPYVPVYLGYDQNVLPFVSCLCAQVHRIGEFRDGNKKVEHYKLVVFDEVCTTPPDNTMILNAREFISRYPRDEFFSTVKVVGDSSLKSGSTLAKSGVTGFSQIYSELRNYISKRVKPNTQGGNPPVALSLEFCNDLLSGEIVEGLKLDFEIHPKCEIALNDLKYQRVGADGKPIKEIHVDKEKKQRWEANGHTSDILRYLIIRIFNNYWLKYTSQSKPYRRRKVSSAGRR